MACISGPKILTDGLVFAYDMNPIVKGRPLSKSWRGAPTFNASLQDGQNDSSPWNGDGSPTSLGIDPNIRFRGRKVAKFQVGTSRNCYINGAVDLSTSTTSTVWTTTIYLKRVDGAAISSVGMYQYITNNSNVNNTVNVTPVEDGWYQAVYTRSGLVAGYPSLTGMYNLGVAGDQYYFADWQCENNSFSTPWVSGTRSNTQALLDLTGTNTITLQSLVEYNSDGTFSFDGTNFNSYASFPSQGINNKSYSVECWFNADTVNRTQGILGDLQYDWWRFNINSSNKVDVFHKESDALGGSGVVGTTNIQSGVWYQAVMVFDINVGMSLYVNGQLDNSNTDTQPFYPSLSNRGPQYIGHYRSGVPTSANVFDGKVGIIKIYKDKVLTADEVLNNFEATRGRYGL